MAGIPFPVLPFIRGILMKFLRDHVSIIILCLLFGGIILFALAMNLMI